MSPPISTASGLNARIAATSGSLSVPYTLSCRSDKNTQRNAAPSGSFGLSISYWSVTKCFFSYSERSKSPTAPAASAAAHAVIAIILFPPMPHFPIGCRLIFAAVRITAILMPCRSESFLSCLSYGKPVFPSRQANPLLFFQPHDNILLMKWHSPIVGHFSKGNEPVTDIFLTT